MTLQLEFMLGCLFSESSAASSNVSEANELVHLGLVGIQATRQVPGLEDPRREKHHTSRALDVGV